MVVNRTVDLYWGRSSRIWCCRSLLGWCGRKWGDRSLLGTEWKGRVLLIPTGDDDEENDTVNLYWDAVVGFGAVCLYWRRCGRLPQCRSLLGTLW